MRRTATALPLLAKEARALLPFWAGSVAALTALSFWTAGNVLGLALFVYIVGAVAIGAQSIGQEHLYRTLPMLLSQPAARGRLYLIKFVVAAGFLLALAATAWMLFGHAWNGEGPAAASLVLPLLIAIFLGPLFTMVTRSPLAGMILSVCVPGIAWTSVVVIAWFGFGVGENDVAKVVFDRWHAGALVVCPLFGLLGWRRFATLEARDASVPALHLPGWLSRAEGVRQHAPLRALAAKEVHLQLLAFALAGLYLASWVAAAVWQRYVPSTASFPFGAVMLLYCMGLAILIGSIASADERQQGTLDLQLLQPAPAWQQWIVKAGVALGLATIFCVVMPLVLIATRPLETNDLVQLARDLTLVVLLLTTGSLYVSSVSSSGVWAMACSLPIGIVVGLMVQAVMPASVDPSRAMLLAARGFALTLVPMLLWLGFLNHARPAQARRVLVMQAASIGVLIAIGIFVAGRVVASA